MEKIKYLELSTLEALPTPRLLVYYKKMLPKIRKYQNSFYCSCCGCPLYEIDSKLFSKEENAKRRADHKEALDKSEYYLASIKDLLSKREHVIIESKKKKTK